MKNNGGGRCCGNFQNHSLRFWQVRGSPVTSQNVFWMYPHSLFKPCCKKTGQKCGPSLVGLYLVCRGVSICESEREKSRAEAIKNQSADSYRAICGQQGDNGRIQRAHWKWLYIVEQFSPRVAPQACPHGAYEQIWDSTSKSINLDHPHH